MERNELLAVCLDAIKGVNGEFSAKQTSDEIRAAIVELNGGSTKINPKTFRPGNALFELVQELIPAMIDEGLKADDTAFAQLVEYRNVKDGDEMEFDVEGDANFLVGSVANGIRDVRRQRITGGGSVKVTPVKKIVRVYDELDRFLSGRIDMAKLSDGIAKAFKKYVFESAYTALSGISASTYGLSATYVKSGSYSEAGLITLIQHVEAATGKKAKILGTKAALRKIGASTIGTSNEVNFDLYNYGCVQMWNGTPCIELPQIHTAGTENFAFADDAIFVIAGDDKIVKVVNEGEGLLIEKNATSNADLTAEMIYIQGIGTGIVVAEKLGYWSSIT